MKRGLTAALPLFAALALYTFFSASEPTGNTYRWVGIFSRALAAVGCFIGAVQFDRRDYMRKAWTLLGVAYAGFFLNAVVFGAVSHGAQRDISTASAVTSGVIVSLANLSTVAGAILVSRAWRAAGLDLMVGQATRRSVSIGSALLGILVAGPAAVAGVRMLSAGQLDGIIRIASSLGDIVTLAVLGPVLLTALALRGGALAWPWGMIVAGTVGWLVYDGTLTVMSVFALDRVRSVEESLRLFACASFFSAGLLQRQVVARQPAAPSGA